MSQKILSEMEEHTHTLPHTPNALEKKRHQPRERARTPGAATERSEGDPLWENDHF